MKTTNKPKSKVKAGKGFRPSSEKEIPGPKGKGWVQRECLKCGKPFYEKVIPGSSPSARFCAKCVGISPAEYARLRYEKDPEFRERYKEYMREYRKRKKTKEKIKEPTELTAQEIILIAETKLTPTEIFKLARSISEKMTPEERQQRNKEYHKKYMKKYSLEHAQQNIEYQRKYRATHKEEYKSRMREYMRKRREQESPAEKERRLELNRQRRKKKRDE